MNGKKDPNINIGLLGKTLTKLQNDKYNALADFFHSGGIIDVFSVDMYFNGESFLMSEPFIDGKGGIRFIDFGRNSAIETSEFKPYLKPEFQLK